MPDAIAVLRRLEEYEETLHIACLAPRTGRVVPLRCDAFAGLYDCLADQSCFEAVSRRLVQSHWAASAIIDRFGAAPPAADELQELTRVRDDIHGQLREIRRSLARNPGRQPASSPQWLRDILFRRLR